MTESSRTSWFREELERAKKRNALIPPHARMIVTNPILSAHTRTTAPKKSARQENENDVEEDVGDQMALAVRAMAHHAAGAWRTDRAGWTDEQWIRDADALMNDLDGSVSSLVNGHVLALLRFWENHQTCAATADQGGETDG